MGSGYPKGGGVQDAFDGPHIGHPILRCRNRLGPGGTQVSRPWWVCVGRLKGNEDDEVWTRSRRFLRKIYASLDYDNGWHDAYLSKGGLHYDKPFITRSIAERELNEAVNLAELSESKLTCTMMSEAEAVMTNGLLTERIFDLLVTEKVIKHPTLREFSPVWSSSSQGKSEWVGRRIERSSVWQVDQDAADLWLATRLLLLDMNRTDQ